MKGADVSRNVELADACRLHRNRSKRFSKRRARLRRLRRSPREANAQPGIYEQAERGLPEAFWKSWADKLDWMKPYETVLEWNEPFARVVRRAVSSTFPSTASIATSECGARRSRRFPLRRRAGRPSFAITYRRTAARRVQARQRIARTRHQAKATASRSTCR